MKDNTMNFYQEVSYFAIKKLQLKLSYEGKQSHLWSELAKESQPSKLKLYNLQSRVSRCIFSQITALHLCDCMHNCTDFNAVQRSGSYFTGTVPIVERIVVFTLQVQ